MKNYSRLSSAAVVIGALRVIVFGMVIIQEPPISQQDNTKEIYKCLIKGIRVDLHNFPEF